jgi:nucleoid-associated protein YgaU
MRSIVWLGSAMAALLIAFAAVVGLRGTAPPSRPAPQPTAAAPSQPAATPATTPAAPAKPPSFDIVRIDPQGQAVIAGRAAPGDRVRVLDGDKPIGEVTADARGEWVLVPDAPIAPGNRQLGLEATGREGGPVRRSGDIVALSVMPPQPTSAPEGQALSLDTAEFGARDRLVLSGHADPGARLNVYAGERLLGTVTADPAGKWSLMSPHREPAGGFELRLDQLAADGSVARRIAAPLERPTTGALAHGGTYVVRNGNSLWLIARHFYGQGTRYTAIYIANREQIRDPNRIYPGQQFKLPKS